MFRRRLYAQSFTLIAAAGGSVYFKSERTKRREFDGKVAERKAQEKRDAWIRELEARDQDDKDWRAKMDAIASGNKIPAELKVPAVITKKATSVTANEPKDATKESGEAVMDSIDASKDIKEVGN